MSDLIKQIFPLPIEFERLAAIAAEELEETGEVSPQLQEELRQCVSNREEYLTALGNWNARTESELAGLEAQYKPQIDRMQKEMKWLKQRLQFIELMAKLLLPEGTGPDSQYVNDEVYLYYTESKRTEIYDADAIPFEYLSDPEPKTGEIKRSLENGVEVPGARLQPNYNLQIKPGGPKAIAAARKRAARAIVGPKTQEGDSFKQQALLTEGENGTK